MLKKAYELCTPWAKANSLQILKNRIISKIVSGFYMLYHMLLGPRDKHQAVCDAVISLTSFPPRINGLYYCLCSLVQQEYKPKKIVLWLAENQFPEREKAIPKRILKLQKLGVDIRFCEDLRSYKKIVFSAQEFVGENIVIVDDDTLYSEDWLKKIWSEHLRYGNSVICYRAHQITVENGILKPYEGWNKLAPEMKGPSISLMPVGVGGVFYPKNCFKDAVWDSKAIRKLAPTTDDIWLKCMMVCRGYKTVKVDIDSIEMFSVLGTQKERLVKMNVENGNTNDISMRNCMNYFQLKATDFLDCKEDS